MDVKLKLCPFCSGKAKLEDYGLNGHFVVVRCLGCGAMTRLFAKGIRLGETAFDAWNKRRSDCGFDNFNNGVASYRTTKGKWIRNDNGTYSCNLCQSWIPEEQHHYARYCLYCGEPMSLDT